MTEQHAPTQSIFDIVKQQVQSGNWKIGLHLQPGDKVGVPVYSGVIGRPLGEEYAILQLDPETGLLKGAGVELHLSLGLASGLLAVMKDVPLEKETGIAMVNDEGAGGGYLSDGYYYPPGSMAPGK